MRTTVALASRHSVITLAQDREILKAYAFSGLDSDLIPGIRTAQPRFRGESLGNSLVCPHSMTAAAAKGFDPCMACGPVLGTNYLNLTPSCSLSPKRVYCGPKRVI